MYLRLDGRLLLASGMHENDVLLSITAGVFAAAIPRVGGEMTPCCIRRRPIVCILDVLLAISCAIADVVVPLLFKNGSSVPFRCCRGCSEGGFQPQYRRSCGLIANHRRNRKMSIIGRLSLGTLVVGPWKVVLMLSFTLEEEESV